MSDRADQRTASCSYSKGWRLFSVIILRPGLRLLMKHQWQGKENFPRTGGVILAPNHLSYADWPTVALFTGSHRKRYPVFMIKSAIFEVKVLGPLMRKLGQLPVYRGRGDAGLVLKQAEQALQTEAAAAMNQTAEGVASCEPVLELARRHHVEMPITEVAEAVMRDGLPVAQAASMLASRSAKPEWYGP